MASGLHILLLLAAVMLAESSKLSLLGLRLSRWPQEKSENSAAYADHYSTKSCRFNQGCNKRWQLLAAFKMDRITMHALVAIRHKKKAKVLPEKNGSSFDELDENIFLSPPTIFQADHSHVHRHCLPEAFNQVREKLLKSCSQRCRDSSLWGCFYKNRKNVIFQKMTNSSFESIKETVHCCEISWKKHLMVLEKRKVLQGLQRIGEKYLTHNAPSAKNSLLKPDPACGQQTSDSTLCTAGLVELANTTPTPDRVPRALKKSKTSYCPLEHVFIGECVADKILKRCQDSFLTKMRKCLTFPENKK